MEQEQDAATRTVAPRTLWLHLRFAGEAWTFELGPDEERAIVVGSLLRAQVRIDRAGINPLHFHFERHDDTVRLIPAYRADLSVNGVAVCGPHILRGHATVEFSGLRLDVHISDVELQPVEGLQLRGWTKNDLEDPSDLSAISDGAEPTRVAWRRPTQESTADETRPFRPLFDVHTGNARGAHVNAQRAAPLDAPEAVSLIAIVPHALITPVCCAPATERGPLWPLTPSADGIPGAGVDREEPVSLAPVVHSEPALGVIDLPLLACLGSLTRRRPLRVALGALIGSMMLTLAMLGVAGSVAPNAGPSRLDYATAALGPASVSGRTATASPSLAESQPAALEATLQGAPASRTGQTWGANAPVPAGSRAPAERPAVATVHRHAQPRRPVLATRKAVVASGL